MTAAVAHIIEEVQHLSPSERVELRREIVGHIPMSDDLTDEDFASLAAASFRALDEEEAELARRHEPMTGMPDDLPTNRCAGATRHCASPHR